MCGHLAIWLELLKTSQPHKVILAFMDPIELKRLEVEHDAIVPDAIFCNTLMNAYGACVVSLIFNHSASWI